MKSDHPYQSKYLTIYLNVKNKHDFQKHLLLDFDNSEPRPAAVDGLNGHGPQFYEPRWDKMRRKWPKYVCLPVPGQKIMIKPFIKHG